jgi:hypothetical protein
MIRNATQLSGRTGAGQSGSLPTLIDPAPAERGGKVERLP